MPRAPKQRTGEDPRPLAEQVADALLAADSETSWYLDLAAPRVIRVCKGECSDPELSARDVDDDEERFVEVPALTEAEIHLWMEDFVEACDDPATAALLDHREGANARFESGLDAAGRGADWRRHRREEALRAAHAWLASQSL